ncbi:MAG TPA: SIS domain-containing protein [Acidimicrobiia bacterium]
MGMRDEIFEQPATLGALLVDGPARASEIAAAVSGCFDHVVIAARGTSDNAARYAQYLWGIHNRLPVGLATPSVYGPYGAPPRLGRAMVVAISQSGQSPDLVAVVAAAAAQGVPTIALTNDAGSPLAGTADHAMALCAGPEAAVAATKTYTASLAAVALLADALAPGSGLLDELRRVPDAVARALETEEQVAAVASQLGGERRCAVLGRGYHYATAFEWALKLEELAYVVAQPHSSADFEHGPRAMVEPGFPVLAAVADGPLYAESAALLEDLGARRGATTVAVSDRDDIPASHVLPIPGGLPEALTPIAAIVPAQLFAYHLAVAAGHDPDHPRDITKVTRTR